MEINFVETGTIGAIGLAAGVLIRQVLPWMVRNLPAILSQNKGAIDLTPKKFTALTEETHDIVCRRNMAPIAREMTLINSKVDHIVETSEKKWEKISDKIDDIKTLIIEKLA